MSSIIRLLAIILVPMVSLYLLGLTVHGAPEFTGTILDYPLLVLRWVLPSPNDDAIFTIFKHLAGIALAYELADNFWKE